MSSTSRKVTQKQNIKYLPKVRNVLRGGKLYRQFKRALKLVAILKDGKYESLSGKKAVRDSRSIIRDGSKRIFLDHLRRLKYHEWGTVAEIEEYSSRKTLLLDFDMARPIPSLTPFLARLRVIGLRARWCSYRRTRKGWHVAIGIDVALTPSEQVACQFALGSDPQRETMNTRRAISLRVHKHSAFWKRRWNILFLRKL
jgi:hypothetical protein